MFSEKEEVGTVDLETLVDKIDISVKPAYVKTITYSLDCDTTRHSLTEDPNGGMLFWNFWLLEQSPS